MMKISEKIAKQNASINKVEAKQENNNQIVNIDDIKDSVLESFKKIFTPILDAYRDLFNSSEFVERLENIRRRIILRPTPLYFAERFSKENGNIQLYIKREDLTSLQTIYINQTLPIAFVAKELNKKRILVEDIQDIIEEKLINGNLRLVLSVIQRFCGRGENADDLFQVGCVGLIKAIDNFDTSLDIQLSTYRRSNDNW